MITLIVVPPALHLPSLDAECTAAVSYLSSVVPAGEWEVIADTQGTLAGQAGTWRGLPALWDGNILVNGYERIVSYLTDKSNGGWSIDSGLSPEASARQHGFVTCAQPLPISYLY